MSLQQLTHDEIDHLSMIELGVKILKEENKAMNYKVIFNKIAELKDFTDEQKQNMMAQFYTDMNVDGRFLTLGSGMWGLKRWYPVEQAEEEITEEPKKKTKKKKKKAEVIDDVDDDLDVTDDEIDDIVSDLGDDLDDDDFEDDLDEDLEDLEDEVDELEADEDVEDENDDDNTR
ncbi:DNA-directed RNA polymerase subunit delta [Oceanobacillus iheyensis]|uniref:Probable DNA-directed RNA polymerase subunit delta n=1 Tax=Oceanobacillus iheyensis (strain DSM 14371 / CIP 107618 / JCM 11309 / KCTC 3954 / HTE831) TaxID=221109 RepID=RPOE_OCEIH|nr:DNA-directed RNA polymerase subunit delta [Oceanobacillus iheyensis]Q8EM52.1 RecName: Full=Probable DNA-directed RNA polymerase subunit delta; AltName: Full=RNAP delta factor [Oceanobacillus iheyensis HTE831]BAC14964.1 DNA-directed RNA polymerase delta chain [Oceanobacillus iheyensis HTE831]